MKTEESSSFPSLMIIVENIVKTYNGIHALRGVSFEVRRGEIFGLIGPNGAGKTTLIKVLTTLTRPDSGRALIGGVDVLRSKREVKSLIGVVPQENNLDRDLSVYENLLIYGMLHKVKDLRKRIKEVLEGVGLFERRSSLVQHLSGGMQRRLVLARALLPDPEVLFLDEPTTGLDPHMRRYIWELIKKAKNGGKTIILTTHYIEEAESLCDRVAIIHEGRIIALGTPRELKGRLGKYVVEGFDEEGRLLQWFCKEREEAYEVARGIGIPVTIREVNLEDFFISLTGRRIDR